MRITEIELDNVFQHEHYQQEIKGNLIGIVGPNGSGKSNLLKSMRFALSGEVPGKTKDKLLRWGATDGQVTLTMTHNKQQGVIVRSVGTGKVTLKYGEHKATGIKAVNDAILADLGVDKSILETIFVSQGELDTILFDQPSKRELAFQRMCGIGDAAKINKVLGELIVTRFPPLPNYDEQVTANRTQRAELELRHTQVSAAAVNWQAVLAKVDEPQLQQGRMRATETIQAAERAIHLKSVMAQTRQVLDVDQRALKALLESMGGVDLQEIDTRIEQTRKVLEATNRYRKAEADWKASKAQLDGLKEPTMPSDALQKLQGMITDLTGKLADLTANSSLYDRLYKAISGVATKEAECPLCGSRIESIADVETRVLKALKGYKTSQAETQRALEGVQIELASGNSAWATYNTRLHTYTGQFNAVDALFKACEKLSGDPAKMTAEIAGMQQIRKEFEQMLGQKLSLESRLETNEKYHQQYATEMTTLTLALANQGMPDVTADGALEKLLQGCRQTVGAIDFTLTKAQEAKVALAGIQGQIAELKNGMQNLDMTLVELEKRRKQQGAYNDVHDRLEHVRDWFHYANGPHALAVAIMEDLTTMVNSFLQRLNAPFVALVSDAGLAYRCPFTDGRAMPPSGPPDADELSGGQKILLAIAFRLASYAMFSNKQGVLCLDEPSAYLDDENIANFCSLLGKLKEVAQALDLQLFITTHEKSVIPFMDTVLELS